MQPIFVGDVQGCDEEFAELLARAEAQFGSEFELWSVGDLINRGPENRAPLARVRELEERGRARVVLGNHEISLLRCWLGLRELSEFDSFQDVLDAPDADEWMEWIRTRPFVCTGQLGRQPFAMVHASVEPSWSLAEVERAGRQVEERMRATVEGVARLPARRARSARRPARPPHARAQRRRVGRVVGGRADRARARLARGVVGAGARLRPRVRALGDAGPPRGTGACAGSTPAACTTAAAARAS